MTQHHSESGQNRNKRKEHDRRARSYESRTETNANHLSKNGRIAATVLIVIVVIAMTWFLAFGVFHL